MENTFLVLAERSYQPLNVKEYKSDWKNGTQRISVKQVSLTSSIETVTKKPEVLAQRVKNFDVVLENNETST